MKKFIASAFFAFSSYAAFAGDCISVSKSTGNLTNDGVPFATCKSFAQQNPGYLFFWVVDFEGSKLFLSFSNGEFVAQPSAIHHVESGKSK